MREDTLYKVLYGILGVLFIGAGMFFGASFMTLHNQNVELEDLTRQYKQASVENAIYERSKDLMNQGYKDLRPEYTIDDEEYIAWRKANYPTREQHGGISVSFTSMPIEAGEGVTSSDVDFITRCINCIPDNFLHRAIEDGWHVVLIANGEISNEYTVDNPENTATVGQTNQETKEIIFAMDRTTASVVFHEFGHILSDYAHDELDAAGFYSYEEETELADLYNHNANGSVYLYLSHEEQIAQSFDDYLFWPRELKDQAPTLYQIFDITISNL